MSDRFLLAPEGRFAELELDPLAKGMPVLDRPVRLGEIGELGLHALSDIPLPVCVLRRSALEQNLRVMADWCAARGVELAPHGKTTMAPQIAWEQMRAGAWAITVATVAQLRAFHAFGLQRFVVANQIVDTASLRWLADALERDGALEVVCLVDSSAGLSLLEHGLAAARGRVRVLVELGYPGGRTGCRSVDAALELAREVRASGTVVLAGVEAFEGVIQGAAHGATDVVDALLDDLTTLTGRVLDELPDGEVIVSAGGSAFFDRVVERVRPLDPRVRLVLRSGCYVSHDAGLYERSSPLGSRAPVGVARLENALEVWGAVLSRPEPSLALVGLGKRDVSYDVDLPVPLAIAGPEGRRPAPLSMAVVSLNDQHAYLRLDAADPLAPGDLVGVGISHPCTTFERWRVIPVVEDDDRVSGAVITCF